MGLSSTVITPMSGNPLLSVRIPPELNALLPTERGERSRFVLEALQAKLNPPAPEDEVGKLRLRVERLERIIKE